jgi:predicted Zn-dependent protease
VRTVAARFGGSNAQRDVLSLTLVEAAIRSGDAAVAGAIASERTHARPSSPAAWAIAARALEVAGDPERAASAGAQAARLRGRFARALPAADRALPGGDRATVAT